MRNMQKVYFIIGVVFIIGAFIFAYTELIKKNDYTIKYKIPCDPEQEVCFIEICDPEVSTECTGNEEEDTSYYTTVYRNAQNIPVCEDYESSECLGKLAICSEGEQGCYQETCEQVQEEDDSVECSVIPEPEEIEESEEVSLESK